MLYAGAIQRKSFVTLIVQFWLCRRTLPASLSSLQLRTWRRKTRSKLVDSEGNKMKKAQTMIEDKLRKRHYELSERLGRIGRDGRHASGLTPDSKSKHQNGKTTMSWRVWTQPFVARFARLRKPWSAFAEVATESVSVAANRFRRRGLEIPPCAARCVKCEGKLHS